jgi:hypothetical protein
VVRGFFLRAAAVAAAILTISAAAAPTPAPAAMMLSVPGRSSATPWIAASGRFVAVAWGATSAQGSTDVFAAVSRDGGATFGEPVQVNTTAGEARLGGELAPRVAVTRRSGSGDPEIAVLWTARATPTSIKIARSADGGRTYAAPQVLQDAGAAGDRGWPAMAIDDRGAVHVVWLDHRGLAAERKDPAVTHKHGERASGTHDGFAMAQKSGLWYAALSTARPSPARQLTNGVCYCCKTALAAGPDGALFAAWRHVYQGSVRDIAFTSSRDGGRTFAAPFRVSDDAWQLNGCPDDGPAMAVDRSGTVHIAWPTLIAGDTPEGAIFYATTRDGRTFTPRQRVATLGGPKPSHPQIVIDGRGRPIIAWDETVAGRRVAAAVMLRTEDRGTAAVGPAQILSGDGSAIYPVMATAQDGVVAVWTAAGPQGSSIAFSPVRVK